MKKLIAFLLAAALVMGLTACGSTPADESTEPQSVTIVIPTEYISEDAALLGIYEYGTYTNEYADLRCRMDDTWAMYTAEELSQLQSIVGEILDESGARQVLESSGSVTVCCGYSTDGLQNYNINVQNIGLLYGTLLNGESYVDMTIPQMEELLPSMGYQNLTLQKVTVPFLGGSYTALAIEAIIEEIPIYQLQVGYTVGSNLIILTASSYLENTTEDILAMFEPLD